MKFLQKLLKLKKISFPVLTHVDEAQEKYATLTVSDVKCNLLIPKDLIKYVKNELTSITATAHENIEKEETLSTISAVAYTYSNFILEDFIKYVEEKQILTTRLAEDLAI